jgi:hypothetical protein
MHAQIVLHGLQTWRVAHTRREVNMAAHILANAELQTSIENI